MNKELLKILKSQRTRLLNKKCKSIEEFEMVQNKINEVEVKIQMIKDET